MAEVVLCALLIYALRICNVLMAVWMPPVVVVSVPPLITLPLSSAIEAVPVA